MNDLGPVSVQLSPWAALRFMCLEIAALGGGWGGLGGCRNNKEVASSPRGLLQVSAVIRDIQDLSLLDLPGS